MHSTLVLLYPTSTVNNIICYCFIKITLNILDVCRYRPRNERKEEILEYIVCLGFILSMITNNRTNEIPMFGENSNSPLDPLYIIIRICARQCQ